MLNALGEELLGEVLRRLPRKDMKSARLAFRAADATARTHLAAFTCLHLTPRNIEGGGPNWARWPRLTQIRLDGWPLAGRELLPGDPTPDKQQAAESEDELRLQRLQRFFAPPPGAAGDAARAVLGRVNTTVLVHSSFSSSRAAARAAGAHGTGAARRARWRARRCAAKRRRGARAAPARARRR